MIMIEIISKKEALSKWNELNENKFQLLELSAHEILLRQELESIYRRHFHLGIKAKSRYECGKTWKSY